jgi:hypothetical protein
MMKVKEKTMDQRYHMQVSRTWLQVIDTKLFRANAPNGVIVLFVGCGENSAKLQANIQQVTAEYSVAPQNIKFV